MPKQALTILNIKKTPVILFGIESNHPTDNIIYETYKFRIASLCAGQYNFIITHMPILLCSSSLIGPMHDNIVQWLA